jgi:hypothetical protein
MTEPFRHECRVAHIIMLQSAQQRLRRAFFTVFLHVDLKLLNAFFWQWQRFRHPALQIIVSCGLMHKKAPSFLAGQRHGAI